MRSIYPYIFVVICTAMYSFATAQTPVILEVIAASSTVDQYAKFEVEVRLSATYSNPYNYDDIRVQGVFTGPDGRVATVDGFYIENFEFTNYQTGSVAPVGSGTFKIRFAPNRPGQWRYIVACFAASGSASFTEKNFSCTAAIDAVNKGFVRSNGSNYLTFDNGDTYIPIGHNIAWQESNVYLDYKKWVDQLSAKGGNCFRLWNCHWGLGLEWRTGNGYQGLQRYRQNNCFYLDWLFDYCAIKGVNVMLCLQHHGPVSTQVNPNWSDSPYNAVNGGPCVNTWDFFTNETAKKLTKNRLRYTVARWGYQRSVLAWELFNEVDWTDEYATRAGDVRNWHAEMAAFLRSKDPNQHLITTSFADDHRDDATWNLPDIDITQNHLYFNTPNLEKIVASVAQRYTKNFEKPVLNGEFGLGPSGNELIPLDPDGIHFHNGIWSALFAGSAGSGMSWWWDSYIAPRNLYPYYAPLSAVIRQIPLAAARFAPANSGIKGAPGDLNLAAAGGWGAVTDTSLTINANGGITPGNFTLGSFLYGSTWNTQLRRPPVFYVQYAQNGQFIVKTGSQTGTSPKIAIWLDGVKVLESAAATQKTYAISVPSGSHRIKVDNTGTDWIQIESYLLPGLGSVADGYTLISEDKRQAAAWVLHNRYNHDYVKQKGLPPAINNVQLQINGMEAGNYRVRFFDCLTGDVISTTQATSMSPQLTISLPEFRWDVAVLADLTTVAVEELTASVAFSISPNPATPGDAIQIKLLEEWPYAPDVTLLDMSGKILETTGLTPVVSDQSVIQFFIPAHLPAGLYWVRVTTKGFSRALPLVLAGK